jgi:hypothetical protein
MAGGATARVHPCKRHNNPLQYKSGKPRLRPLNITQLTALIDKTQRKKDKSKITREIARKQARLAV